MSQVIGRQLLHARRAAGLTQREVAGRAGIAPSVLCAYEAGRREPSAGIFQRLIAAMGGTVAVEVPTPAERRDRDVAVQDVLALAEALPHRSGDPAERPPATAPSGVLMVGLPDKLLAVHRALDAAGYPHAFGGAIAMAYHVARPRGTDDIDVNVAADPRCAADLFAALPEQVRHTRADARALARDGQCRLHWDRTPLDLFLPQHELHEVVQQRRVFVEFAGTTIPILSATDLVVFKALFDRTKDWADIEEMLRPDAPGRPDLDEVRRWVELLVGVDDDRLQRLDLAAARSSARREPRSFRDAVRRLEDRD